MAIPNPREVIELANEILKAEDRLTLLKERWDLMFGPTAKGITDVREHRKPGRPARAGSLSSMILALLNSGTTSLYDADYVSKKLSEDRERVSNTLHNLYVAKKINRVGRGVYVRNEPDLDAEFEYARENSQEELAQ